MNEKIRKGIVFGLLVIALIWGYNHFFGDRKSMSSQRTQPDVAVLEEDYYEDSTVVAAVPVSENYLSRLKEQRWGKDPFYHNFEITVSRNVERQAALRLLGILYKRQNAQALINGQVVGIGDMVEGYRVTDITRKDVTVSDGRRELKLQVKKESS